jgi:hypothetical protein
VDSKRCSEKLRLLDECCHFQHSVKQWSSVAVNTMSCCEILSHLPHQFCLFIFISLVLSHLALDMLFPLRSNLNCLCRFHISLFLTALSPWIGDPWRVGLTVFEASIILPIIALVSSPLCCTYCMSISRKHLLLVKVISINIMWKNC